MPPKKLRSRPKSDPLGKIGISPILQERLQEIWCVGGDRQVAILPDAKPTHVEAPVNTPHHGHGIVDRVWASVRK